MLPDLAIWLKNSVNVNIEDNLQIYRFCRVPFGVMFSPFLLGATITYHLKQSEAPLAQHLQRNIYVDNLITGVNTLNQAKTLYSEAKSLFATASMNLREWASNSKELMDFIPQDDKAIQSDLKVLRINWNLTNDTLSIPNLSASKIEGISTKREILQMIASIFDPCTHSFGS